MITRPFRLTLALFAGLALAASSAAAYAQADKLILLNVGNGQIPPIGINA